jgi:adenylate cyclase class 1
VPSHGIETDYYAVQAIAGPGDDQSLKVTIFCGQREFSELDHGPGLFAAAAGHILQQRTRTETYPCYITDLDLSAIDPTGSMQTVNYLRYRQQLEDALNAAMGTARN